MILGFDEAKVHNRHHARPRADTDENLTQRRKDTKQVCKYASLQVAGGLRNLPLAACYLPPAHLIPFAP